MKSAVILSALVLAGLGATNVLAQSVISAQSGMINYTEGQVLLNDQDIQVTSTRFPQVRVQDVLSTKEGRVEVLLNPGSFLRIGRKQLDPPGFELADAPERRGPFGLGRPGDSGREQGRVGNPDVEGCGAFAGEARRLSTGHRPGGTAGV